jgi:hypothetical protein
MQAKEKKMEKIGSSNMEYSITLSELLQQLSMLPARTEIIVTSSNSYDKRSFHVTIKAKCFTCDVEHKKILGTKIAEY